MAGSGGRQVQDGGLGVADVTSMQVNPEVGSGRGRFLRPVSDLTGGLRHHPAELNGE